MTIGRGIPWLYDHIVRGLPEETVDEFDAYLGDEGAQQRVVARRRDTVTLAGVEVG